MSYNKLKSLVANVEAIKTALQIHIQGRQATPEEKETLSQYSGFGGIKEVLNIGTDKPVSGDMEEPIRRLQELIDTYPYFTEAMKASVLTAFYTPKFLIDVVAKQIHATFKDNELQMRSFLEPSAGIGGFLPVAMSDTCGYAIEKDPVSGLILSLLNDNTVTRTAGFETIDEQGFEHTKFDVIASNIPFGNFRVFDAELWKKGGIYEQATKTIHNYFFVKALELLNEGGLLAFVTSRGVADTPSNKFVREYLVNHADLISDLVCRLLLAKKNIPDGPGHGNLVEQSDKPDNDTGCGQNASLDQEVAGVGFFLIVTHTYISPLVIAFGQNHIVY